jgi:hypothetical protein
MNDKRIVIWLRTLAAQNIVILALLGIIVGALLAQLVKS